jgi:hypothetical protein
MKTVKGLKLAPAIGEELVSIRQRLIEQKVEKADLELLRLAIKCAKETLRLSDVRAIHKEIAWKRFENWKNQGIEEEQHTIRCYFCGEKILSEDNPWLPLCSQHKTILTTYKEEIFNSLLPKQMELELNKNPKTLPPYVQEPTLNKLREKSVQNISKDGVE